MASTYELCERITKLGGNPEALSDKMTKTLEDEIIRLLSIGSALELEANDIAYEEGTVEESLDSLVEDMTEQQSRIPTNAEVTSAIETMTDEQVLAVKTKLGIQ